MLCNLIELKHFSIQVVQTVQQLFLKVWKDALETSQKSQGVQVSAGSKSKKNYQAGGVRGGGGVWRKMNTEKTQKLTCVIFWWHAKKRIDYYKQMNRKDKGKPKASIHPMLEFL